MRTQKKNDERISKKLKKKIYTGSNMEGYSMTNWRRIVVGRDNLSNDLDVIRSVITLTKVRKSSDDKEEHYYRKR